MTLKLKKDRYSNTRGGYSRLLDISCQKCGDHLCFYQKDGPGILKRMYFDRISESVVPLSGKAIKCLNGHLIGVKIIYEKEDRPAFRLFVDSVKKKVVKYNAS